MSDFNGERQVTKEDVERLIESTETELNSLDSVYDDRLSMSENIDLKLCSDCSVILQQSISKMKRRLQDKIIYLKKALKNYE